MKKFNKNSYGNFKDPFNLVLRMLFSGDKTARSVLMRHILKITTLPCDYLFQRIERRTIVNAIPSNLPLIFIVGAPRSGTTIVSQVLASYLDVSFFSNLTTFFPRSPITIQKHFEKSFISRSYNFNSYYGQTYGLLGINDGFHIWNRWLGVDRYKPLLHLDDVVSNDCSNFFNAWLSIIDKPFLNKNNRLTFCCKLLSEILPNAYFINVSRDPLAVVKSIVKAREHIQGSKKFGWGLGAQDQNSDDPLGYINDICKQLNEININWDNQKTQISPDKVIEIKYEEFCQNPYEHILNVVNKIPYLMLRDSLAIKQLKPFKVSNSRKLETCELERAINMFNKFGIKI